LACLELFFKTHFPGREAYGSMGLFHWRAFDHYIMPGIVNLIKDGDRIVSILSNTPKRISLKGTDCLVAEIGDAFTDPAYQRQGMLTLLTNQATREALEGGIRGVYSTPDAQTPSLPAFINKAGFVNPKNPKIKSLILLLNPGPFLRKRTHWLIGQYGGALFQTLYFLYYLCLKGWGRTTSGEIAELQALPDDWDEFWNEASGTYDFILERNRHALTWRFFRTPHKYTFYALRDRGRIVGYAVYRIVADAEIKRMILADFLFLPGQEQRFRKLLTQVLRDALKFGVSYINTWCIEGGPYHGPLKRCGFMARNDILLIWFHNEFAAMLQNQCRSWHFTIADSDNG
jgi:GNAT superfamily N-acetyltransferase